MTKLERHLRNEVQRTEQQTASDYAAFKDLDRRAFARADEAMDAREMLAEFLKIQASHEAWSEHSCPCNCRCCTSGSACRDDRDACQCRGCATNSGCEKV
jgi:hypothetical protein